LVVGFLAPGDTDDAHGLGQLAVAVEVVESGDELSGGEVAASAEDDDAAGLGFSRMEVESTGQEFIQEVRSVHAP
jgi:hypothetical protein